MRLLGVNRPALGQTKSSWIMGGESSLVTIRTALRFRRENARKWRLQPL
jgi:hypothetical protein